MIQKKICMLGAFAVGKTSLVRRYVHSMFTDKYLTTVGVKIDKKDVSLAGKTASLLLWDLYGEDEFQRLQTSYLRGSAGLIVVADGLRPATVDKALELRDRAFAALGPVPYLLVMNKCDLMSEWEVKPDRIAALRESGTRLLFASAKTGEGVESAFSTLASLLLPDGERA